MSSFYLESRPSAHLKTFYEFWKSGGIKEYNQQILSDLSFGKNMDLVWSMTTDISSFKMDWVSIQV